MQPLTLGLLSSAGNKISVSSGRPGDKFWMKLCETSIVASRTPGQRGSRNTTVVMKLLPYECLVCIQPLCAGDCRGILNLPLPG